MIAGFNKTGIFPFDPSKITCLNNRVSDAAFETENNQPYLYVILGCAIFAQMIEFYLTMNALNAAF
jgi:hypothetical protein